MRVALRCRIIDRFSNVEAIRYHPSKTFSNEKFHEHDAADLQIPHSTIECNGLLISVRLKLFENSSRVRRLGSQKPNLSQFAIGTLRKHEDCLCEYNKFKVR